MEIQTIFYILAIAFIISWFIVIVGAAIFLWLTYRKIKKLKSSATEKVDSLTQMGKTEIVRVAVGALGKYFLNRLRKKQRS